MFILAKQDDFLKSRITFLVIIIMSLLHVRHSLRRMSESLIHLVSRGRILGRFWDTSLNEFCSLLFTVTSTNGFYPLPHPTAKVVWNWFVMSTLYKETTRLRTLNIIPETSTKLYVHEFGLPFYLCTCTG